MTPVRSADRRNMRRMSRRGKPVVNRRADSTALHGRVAGTVVPSNQEHHALAGDDRPLKSTVDGAPRRIEVHSVQIEDAIRLDRAAAKALVPAAVESAAAKFLTGTARVTAV
jgi:hypothetical protein